MNEQKKIDWNKIKSLTQLMQTHDRLLSVLSLKITEDHLPRNYLGKPIALETGFPFLMSMPDEGKWVELSDDAFNLFYTERGEKNCLLKNVNAEELLYRIFKDTTATLASAFECRHRIPYQDSRRQWFKHQEELMGELCTVWRERLAKEHAHVLQKFPFDDSR